MITLGQPRGVGESLSPVAEGGAEAIGVSGFQTILGPVRAGESLDRPQCIDERGPRESGILSRRQAQQVIAAVALEQSRDILVVTRPGTPPQCENLVRGEASDAAQRRYPT